MCEQNYAQPLLHPHLHHRRRNGWRRRETAARYLNAARLVFRPRRPRVAPRSPSAHHSSCLRVCVGGGHRRPNALDGSQLCLHSLFLFKCCRLQSGPHLSSPPVRPVSPETSCPYGAVGRSGWAEEAAGLWAGVSD